MTTITTRDALRVSVPTAPRGARIAADLFVQLFRRFTQPTVVRKANRAQEAAAVRDLAYHMQNTDPGFAADLFAAAARHESLDD